MTRDPFYRLVFLLSILAAVVIGAVLLRWWLFPIAPMVPVLPTPGPVIVLPAPSYTPTATIEPTSTPTMTVTSLPAVTYTPIPLVLPAPTSTRVPATMVQKG